MAAIAAADDVAANILSGSNKQSYDSQASSTPPLIHNSENTVSAAGDF